MNEMLRGRGGLGLVAGWGNRAHDGAVAERMSAAAPHRGATLRTVRTENGFVGVTGDAGVMGVVESGGWGLAFAGAVDNPDDLGVDRDSDGDRVARIILDMIRRQGPVTLSRLRGFFAIAAVTPDSLILGRDHLGLAALFFRYEGRNAWAASEAKQVVAGSEIRREPDLEVVTAVFFGRDDENLPSALAGVERVPRAGTVVVKGGPRVKTTYWDPAALVGCSSVGLQDLPDLFHHHMDRAARRAMRGADAISLSGGIDSPAVAGYAAPAHVEAYGAPLEAVSFVYPDTPSVDESQYIQMVADRLGMPLHTRVPVARPTDDLARWVQLLDGPFPVISVAESSEFYGFAGSLGFDSILTGEWAEFLTEMGTHALQQLLIAGRFGPARRRYQLERHSGRSTAALARRVLPTMLPDSLREVIRRVRGKPDRVAMPEWIVGRSTIPSVPVPVRRRWAHDQLSFFAGAGIMIEAHDVIATMHRIDVRRPFADIDLWELFLGLRTEVKHADPRRKGLLRGLLRGRVPDEILDRRDKTVFDENLLSRIDYPTLERWLIHPKHRLAAIDYDLVADRLEQRALDLREFMWMKDLAAVHAFLEQW